MAKVSPGEFVNQVKTEASKIVWPTGRETVMTGVMVVIMTTLLGLFFDSSAVQDVTAGGIYLVVPALSAYWDFVTSTSKRLRG